jgi:hypothetical protein
MPSIFLSHTSIDKPFVEKLAYDLRKVGVNVWFDKWEIKVGDSITWKIEEGIRENEFLGIVLSQEALKSEWVRSELGAAWVRQMQTKKVFVLPVLYRDCDIPLFLADRKYADFRNDYQSGFEELAAVLGIKQTDLITDNNWRRFTSVPTSDWKTFREKEFEQLVTALVDRAIEYNWSSWVGASKNPFTITLSAFVDRDRSQSVSLKLNGRTYAYMAHLGNELNTNDLKISDFTIYVGNTINECEEFVWRIMEDFNQKFGAPPERAHHFVEKFLGTKKRGDFARKVVQELRWYKGDKI